MAIIARPGTPGPWVDFSSWPTSLQLQAFRDAGIIGCLVYGPLPGVSDVQKAHDLTPSRLMLLTNMGFEVLLVQHCRYPDWDPRAHSGADDAASIVAHAQWCKYPDTAHIYQDWEGVNRNCSAADGAQFIEDWGDGLGLFGGALYVGYQQPLNPDQLYALHEINSYASDIGHRRVSVRGVAFSQGPQVQIAGATVDTDELHPDQLRELPIVATYEPDAQDVA